MLNRTVSHYAPHDEDTARCGAVVTPSTRHSTSPTCAACAASVAVLEGAPAHTDADAPVAQVCAVAVAVTRSYANCFPPEARLFAERRLGGRR
jgi:hypothetical protein